MPLPRKHARILLPPRSKPLLPLSQKLTLPLLLAIPLIKLLMLLNSQLHARFSLMLLLRLKNLLPPLLAKMKLEVTPSLSSSSASSSLSALPEDASTTSATTRRRERNNQRLLQLMLLLSSTKMISTTPSLTTRPHDRYLKLNQVH